MATETLKPNDDGDRKLLSGIARTQWAIIALTFFLLGIAVWLLLATITPEAGPILPLPALVPAPAVDEQNKLLAAMKAHPNPPLDTDSLPALGSDAAGLTTLFAGMTKSENDDGSHHYWARVAQTPGGHEYDATYVVIEVAGNPPRIVRRRVEPSYSP